MNATVSMPIDESIALNNNHKLHKKKYKIIEIKKNKIQHVYVVYRHPPKCEARRQIY